MTNTPDDETTARREAAMDALVQLTAQEWNVHPRNRIQVMSWGDFGRAAAELEIDGNAPMSWNTFRKIRGRDVLVKLMVPWNQLTDDD